ncbi:MAG TPA: winged helix-turn-helix domain-containing protein, partial [Hydrogenophaga sp.]|nr:winged helix-turn-helix domain-containing protein [Hydrogenophaga sp.]
VRAILRRSARSSGPSLATVAPDESLPLQLDEVSQRVLCGGESLALTRYEYSLLVTLLRRPGRIFSRTELMDLVWAGSPDTSDRTVDAHVKLLRAKLRERGLSPDVIQTHRNMGYSLQLPG